MRTFLKNLETYSFNKIFDFLEADYKKNFPILLDWIELFDREGRYSSIYTSIKQAITDPQNC